MQPEVATKESQSDGWTQSTLLTQEERDKLTLPRYKEIVGKSLTQSGDTLKPLRGDEHKFDADKLMWDLLPMGEVEEVVGILTYGAKKYRPNGWKEVPDAESRYYAAALRHLIAWRQGEDVDKESNLRHLAHATCNLLFLMYKTKETK